MTNKINSNHPWKEEIPKVLAVRLFGVICMVFSRFAAALKVANTKSPLLTTGSDKNASISTEAYAMTCELFSPEVFFAAKATA